MKQEKKQALLDGDAHKILMDIKEKLDLKSLSAAIRHLKKQVKKDS